MNNAAQRYLGNGQPAPPRTQQQQPWQSNAGGIAPQSYRVPSGATPTQQPSQGTYPPSRYDGQTLPQRQPSQPSGGASFGAAPSLTELSQRLRNLPPQLAGAVMDDYRADVFRQAADPDSRTNAATPLQERIERASQRLATRRPAYDNSY